MCTGHVHLETVFVDIDIPCISLSVLHTFGFLDMGVLTVQRSDASPLLAIQDSIWQNIGFTT